MNSVCYRSAIMLEEAAEWELRQLDTSLRLDPGQGIQTRGEAWHGMDQAADSLGVILYADEWCWGLAYNSSQTCSRELGNV